MAADQLSVEDQLSLVIDVERDSWKGKEGSAIGCSVDNVAFYNSLAKRLHQNNSLAIHYLELNGEVVAANLGIHFGTSLLLWKLGYRDEFKKISPGGLLMQSLLQHIDENPRIKRIDLMTNESWYSNWNMQWRPFYDLYIYRLSIKSVYLFTMQTLKSKLKKYLNR